MTYNVACHLKSVTDTIEGIARYAVAQRARQIMTAQACVQQEIRSRKLVAHVCEQTRALEIVTKQSGAYARAVLAANELQALTAAHVQQLEEQNRQYILHRELMPTPVKILLESNSVQKLENILKQIILSVLTSQANLYSLKENKKT